VSVDDRDQRHNAQQGATQTERATELARNVERFQDQAAHRLATEPYTQEQERQGLSALAV